MRRALLAAMTALILLAPAPALGAVEPGIVASLPFTARDLQNIRDLNAKTVRFFMFTSQDPAAFDDAVRQVESAGAKPLFVVLGNMQDPPTTPAEIRDYADYIGRAAAHFKGRTAGWEVWNEPDGPKFWAGNPPFDENHLSRDATDYAKLLEAAHDAIRAADPVAKVVAGGLTGSDHSFLSSLYDHGAKGDFDAVAVHTDTACQIGSPYDYLRDRPGGPVNQFSWLGLLSIRDVMTAHGDGDTPVWLTEIGWSSYDGVCRDGKWAGQKAAGVGEANQAAYLLQAMHCARVRKMDWLTKAVLFVLNEPEDPDPMNTGYGAVRQDGSHKPVFDAWRSYALHGDLLPDSEPCGDFDAPAVRVEAPAGGTQFAGALPIRVSAEDPAGVPRITLLVDHDTKIRNFTDRAAPQTLGGTLRWQGAKRLSLGRHRIVVVAVDRHGNTAREGVDVVKVDPSKLKRIRTRVVTALRGAGRRRTLTVRLVPRAVGLTSLLGKVEVVAQRRRHGRWVSAHRYARSAKGADRSALAFGLRLEPGRWRIVVRYRARKRTSYRGTTRVLRTFVVR